MQTLKDHAAGKPLPGMNPASYRVRSGRFEAKKGVPFVDAMEECVAPRHADRRRIVHFGHVAAALLRRITSTFTRDSEKTT